jgi:hypothetical protein
MDLGHRGSHDRRHSEFLAFLKQVAGAYPRRRLQVICDNYATDKQPVVQGWLASTRGSCCTSRRPRRPGSTWSRCSSPSSTVRPFAATTSQYRRPRRRHQVVDHPG